jgi:flagellin-like protein
MIRGMFTHKKKAVSSVIGTVIIVGVTIFLAVLIGFGYSSITEVNTRYTVLAFQNAYCFTPVTVENAKWQINILLQNKGTHNIYIDYLSVNSQSIDEYGVLNGDTLPSGSVMGTSIPKSGITIEPGESLNANIWIGKKLFSSGSTIEIQIENISSTKISRTVKLT